jgi:uncharacterized protein YdaU (DUF1376 family)
MARTPNNHHVLPLFCDDLIASCVDMSPARFGAYMRLLCYAWTRGGLPNDEAACGRIAGGIDQHDWEAIRSRLILLDAGTPSERLSHQRLELERQAVAALKAKKSEAGKKGGRPKANGKLSQSKTKAEPQADGKQNQSKTKAPTPTPTHSSSLRSEEEFHTHGENEFWKPGWAATEWDAFVAVWNSTQRAARWDVLSPPDGWVDAAASPGWLQKARQAVQRLPMCLYLEKPLAVTQFIQPGWADRILAGEFDNPRARPAGRHDSQPPPVDQAKRRFYRADAGKSMSEAEYSAWRRDHATGGTVAAVADRVTLRGNA